MYKDNIWSYITHYLGITNDMIEKERLMYNEATDEAYPSQSLGGLAKEARMMRPRTKLERLNDMKKILESKLAEINETITALEANPEMTKVIDLLEKVGI